MRKREATYLTSALPSGRHLHHQCCHPQETSNLEIIDSEINRGKIENANENSVERFEVVVSAANKFVHVSCVIIEAGDK